MIQSKPVQYRLLSKTTQRLEDGTTIEVYPSRSTISSRYNTRDEGGRSIQEVISVGVTVDPKTKKEVPIEVDKIEFIEGYLTLYTGKDQHIIDGLDKSVNNKSFKNRFDSDLAIFERVDFDKEDRDEITLYDLVVEAYTALSTATFESVIEYAKALNIDTTEMDAYLSSKGRKKDDLKQTPEYDRILVKLKKEAKKDPKVFVVNFTNPLRPLVAIINDGLKFNVITFVENQSEYAWVMGTNKTPIIQIPRGIEDPKKWFAAWLKDSSKSTLEELTSRIEAAKKMN